MESDAVELPQDSSSIQRSAYEYSIECSFQSLHSPNIDFLVEMLQKHHDYIGFHDKISLLSFESNELLTSSKFWDPFAKRVIIGIKCILTGDQKEL